MIKESSFICSITCDLHCSTKEEKGISKGFHAQGGMQMNLASREQTDVVLQLAVIFIFCFQEFLLSNSHDIFKKENHFCIWGKLKMQNSTCICFFWYTSCPYVESCLMSLRLFRLYAILDLNVCLCCKYF